MLRTGIWLLLCLTLIVAVRESDRRMADVDLGTVRFPRDAMDAPVTLQDWRETAGRRRYRLGYGHGTQAAESIAADHERFGRKNQFKWKDEKDFFWRMTPECVGQEWACIYAETFRRSAVDLEPFLDRIQQALEDESWSTLRASRWLLSLVQQIPYAIPTEHAFGVLPPALVVSQDWGDCDSKSLLLMELLERVGIDAILLTSEAHAHALVGIAVPSVGFGFKHLGREYAWAETTAAAPLGWLHPSMRLPNDWQVVPFERLVSK